eukprot:m.18297 g.18297  ORF g.18297 m.18297 type:complete len:532 (+) comp3326_c0_seq1:416-2011(+)
MGWRGRISSHRERSIQQRAIQRSRTVNIGLEGVGQRGGDEDRAVRVVALAHVQHARERRVRDHAELSLVEAVLAAAEGEDDRVGGRAQREVAVVVALALVAVAASDHKEVLDVALLDGLDDLTGQRENGVVAEADGDRLLGALDALLGKALHALGLLDDCREVLGIAVDVRHLGPADSVGGVDAVRIRLARLDQAVGGHDDGAGELGELKLLELPRATVVADKVLVLLQAGVAVGGEHLAVGVHVHAGALGLLQQLLEIVHVVAGNEDALPGHGGDLDGRGDWVSELRRVALVEHLEDVEVGRADIHGHADELAGVGCRHPGKQLLHLRVHRCVLLAQQARVRSVSSNALQAVDNHLLQGGHLLAILRLVRKHAARLGLLQQPARVRAVHVPVRRRRLELLRRLAGLLASILVGLAGVSHESCGLGQQLRLEILLVEVDIGQGRKQRVQDEPIGLRVLGGAHQARIVQQRREALEVVDQQILQGGDLRCLAAHADGRAALAALRLLALLAEHVAAQRRRGAEGAEGGQGGL